MGKQFRSGSKTLTIEFDKGGIELTVSENGQKTPVDKLTSHSKLTRETITDYKWFLEKHGQWFVEVYTWWVNEGYPSVQSWPVYNQKKRY